jgi:hypothetical protein
MNTLAQWSFHDYHLSFINRMRHKELECLWNLRKGYLTRGQTLGRNWNKSIVPPPPPRAKVVWNILYSNLNSENSQYYAQKPQRNCKFMNSASELARAKRCLLRCCQWWNKKARALWGYPKPLMNCTTTKAKRHWQTIKGSFWMGGGGEIRWKSPQLSL